MLLQLSINQFGIISNSVIDFAKGLTVLSGETGAGKSMILGAISQLTGQRTSTSYIRYGEDKATIEGIFEVPQNEEFYNLLNNLELSSEDDIIILRRDIYSSGKSICKINNISVNLNTLKQVSSYLIDIHEQHDNQKLLQEKNHLKLIDSYGENFIKETFDKYNEKYQEYSKLLLKIEKLEKKEDDMIEKLDFLKYQHKEISSLNLQKDEDTVLQEELQYLENYERINSLLSAIKYNLNSDNGVLSSLYEIKESIEELLKYNIKFEDKYEEVNNAYYFLEDLQYEISKVSNSVDYDEERLNELEYRLSNIQKLKKKHKKDLNELIDYEKDLELQIEEIENYDDNLKFYKDEKNRLEKELTIIAEDLTKKRKLVSEKLEILIKKELQFLCMEKSVIKIQITEKEFSQNGKDDVKILISANLGEPLKSLSKVASGGELSRIMLALKIIFASKMDSLFVIFDEIDTGISGRVSQKMAEKMYQLSINSQVLCISHLPQTTALADTNFLITKEVLENRTVSTVKALTEQEKVLELARMISGDDTTKLSKEHATELLSASNNIKNILRNKELNEK